MLIRINYSFGNNYSQQFLKEVEPQIVNMANNFLIPGFTPEDTAQELRLHIWSKMPLYNPRKGNVKGWTYIVCRNKLADMQSKSYSQKSRKKQDILNLGNKRIKPLNEE